MAVMKIAFLATSVFFFSQAISWTYFVYNPMAFYLYQTEVYAISFFFGFVISVVMYALLFF
jgi:hypothetical protein